MQAPPTSGTPAQDRPVLVCPACRALNGGGGVFWWQCYRPFNGGEAVNGGQAANGAEARSRPRQRRGSRGPAPATATALSVRGSRGPLDAAADGGSHLRSRRAKPSRDASRHRARRRGGRRRVDVMNRSPDVALPQSFGGLSQMQDDQIDVLLDDFRAGAVRQGVEADMALYGSAGLPSAGLIWVKDLTVPSTDEAFDAFATGFDQELGVGSLDRSRRSTSTIDGISFLCAPADASGQPANLCLWEDENGVFSILLDLSGTAPLSGTEQLAVSAHGATSA